MKTKVKSTMPDSPIEPPVGTRRMVGGSAAIALVVGLAALTAQASESDLVTNIQRYCAACWRNARLDPGIWDDCTQEVCCRLLTKARAGRLDLNMVLAEDTEERRELVRAIDMVRKRVQRAKRFLPLDDQSGLGSYADMHDQERRELGEILEAARSAVLSPRQDRIVELWTRGWTVPEIADSLCLPAARVSDEKYKALRKLERRLVDNHEDLDVRETVCRRFSPRES